MLPARAEAAVCALRTQFENRLDAFEKSIGGGRILAIGVIKRDELNYFSDGVTFDQASGMIIFSNPKSLRFEDDEHADVTALKKDTATIQQIMNFGWRRSTVWSIR